MSFPSLKAQHPPLVADALIQLTAVSAVLSHII